MYRWLGVIQAASGSPDQAAVTFRRGLEVAPEHTAIRRELGVALLLASRPEEALRVFEGGLYGWHRDFGLALAYSQLGRDADSRAALGRLVAADERGASIAYHIAQVHAWRGEKDQAFRWLEKGLAVRDPGITYIKFDPLISSLRSDPRYAALLEEDEPAGGLTLAAPAACPDTAQWVVGAALLSR